MKESLNHMKLMIEVTDEDVFLFFKRFNLQQDGLLTYQEMRQAMAPLLTQLRPEDNQHDDPSILEDD